MDPEIRYGRAYVPRSTYSYITTTNLDRKSRNRGYSQPAPVERDWKPTTTYWMPKRDWYYGAYEDLYAPNSSLKSRLQSKDTNVSRRRLVDDIHYELNRFRPPHLASEGTYPSRRIRDSTADTWQDRLDMYYPTTNSKPYISDYVKDNFSNARLSRRSRWNNETLNDLNYDYNILHRGRLNDHPGLPRRSPYGAVSVQPSLYEDVKDYLFPSHRPFTQRWPFIYHVFRPAEYQSYFRY
jgi:hypothetical protein